VHWIDPFGSQFDCIENSCRLNPCYKLRREMWSSWTTNIYERRRDVQPRGVLCLSEAVNEVEGAVRMKIQSVAER